MGLRNYMAIVVACDVLIVLAAMFFMKGAPLSQAVIVGCLAAVAFNIAVSVVNLVNAARYMGKTAKLRSEGYERAMRYGP